MSAAAFCVFASAFFARARRGKSSSESSVFVSSPCSALSSVAFALRSFVSASAFSSSVFALFALPSCVSFPSGASAESSESSPGSAVSSVAFALRSFVFASVFSSSRQTSSS